MANLIPKLLYMGNLESSNVYTAPVSTTSYAILRNINICSYTTNQTLLNINLIPPSGTASANNLILSNFVIAGNETVSYDAGIVIESGYSIWVEHSGDLNLTISGVEYSA